MTLQIVMDEQTKQFLSTKKVLTISRFKQNHSCVPAIEVTTTFLNPSNKQRYYHISRYSIPIYIEKGLDFKENKVIIKKRFASICVEGLIRF